MSTYLVFDKKERLRPISFQRYNWIPNYTIVYYLLLEVDGKRKWVEVPRQLYVEARHNEFIECRLISRFFGYIAIEN